MQVAFETLRLLSDGKFHSGSVLANQLSVSRSSIWKGIAYLRRLNIPIQAVTGRGYRWLEPLVLLNKKEIRALLTDNVASLLPRIDIFNVIPSTNDCLIQRLTQGIPSGTVCIAEMQTAGKGRMGRHWHSPFAANVYLSLYWQFNSRVYDLSGLSLVVGVAVLHALKEIAPLPHHVGIKWPNDIWYNDAKFCGILIEAVGKSSSLPQVTDVVMGIGINVNIVNKQEPTLSKGFSDLNQIFGFVPSRNVLIGHVLNTLVSMLDLFQREGFSAFSAEWSHYDLLRGKKIELYSEHQTQIGIAQGINERGELCIKIGESLKAVRYGDVSVRPEVCL